MYRKLTAAELDVILSSINKEQHFLYYSYLTFRRQNTVHYGQYSDQGELLGVLAFLSTFRLMLFLYIQFSNPFVSAQCWRS